MKNWLTGIHGDDGDLVTRLRLSIEGAQQGNLSGRGVDAEETLVAVFDQVADLVVRRRVGVVGPHGDDGRRQLLALLHDVSDVGRVEEGRRVVVDVHDGDGGRGRVVADVVARILGLHRQHVLVLALKVQVLGHADDARVLADAEVDVDVAAHDRVAHASVQVVVQVGGRHLQHRQAHRCVFRHRSAVHFRVEERTVVVLVHDVHQHVPVLSFIIISFRFTPIVLILFSISAVFFLNFFNRLKC